MAMSVDKIPFVVCCRQRDKFRRKQRTIVGPPGPPGPRGPPGLPPTPSYLFACYRGPTIVGFVPLGVVFETDNNDEYIVTTDWSPGAESGEQTTFSSDQDGIYSFLLTGFAAQGAGEQQDLLLTMSLFVDNTVPPCGTQSQETSGGGTDQFFLVSGIFRYEANQQIQVRFNQELGGSMSYRDVSLKLIRLPDDPGACS